MLAAAKRVGRMALSLRARLLLGVLVLAAVGLGDRARRLSTPLRTFLFQQADDSLDATAASLATAPAGRLRPLAAIRPRPTTPACSLISSLVGSRETASQSGIAQR